MIYATEDTLPENFKEGPPNGSMDWLWYRYTGGPSNWKNSALAPQFQSTSICDNCDTYGVLDPEAEIPICWSCGGELPKSPGSSKMVMTSKHQRLWG